MTQDLNPIQWGAQDRFQAHFIVKNHQYICEDDFLVRPKLETKGYFASKRVTGVQWIGGSLADVMNSDGELEKMLTKIPYEDAQICVEPTKGGIRIMVDGRIVTILL